MTRGNEIEIQKNKNGKLKMAGKALSKVPFIFLGSMLFLVGSWSVSGGIKSYVDSKVPKVDDRNSVIDNISDDKKDFVINKGKTVEVLVNCRLGGDQAQKTAAYQKILTDASKKLDRPGNEYEFYYYVTEGFLEQEKKNGTISYPAKDYFNNILGDLYSANYAQKTKELNKSIEESVGEKRETLIEGSEIIKGFSENSFIGVQITAGRENMLEFYSRIVDKGANKTEAIAALLALYNRFSENKSRYQTEWMPSSEELDNYINKVENDLLNVRAKLVANAAVGQD